MNIFKKYIIFFQFAFFSLSIFQELIPVILNLNFMAFFNFPLKKSHQNLIFHFLLSFIKFIQF